MLELLLKFRNENMGYIWGQQIHSLQEQTKENDRQRGTLSVLINCTCCFV